MTVFTGAATFAGAGGGMNPKVGLMAAAIVLLAGAGSLGPIANNRMGGVQTVPGAGGVACVATISQLDASAPARLQFAQAVIEVDATGRPIAASTGGNLNVTTLASGATFVAFASQVCKRLYLANNTGTAIEFLLGGAGVAFPVQDKTQFTINGLANANQVSLRRVDTSATPVTANGHWEN